MCGIVGIVLKNHVIDNNLIQKMCNQIRHRGPDDEGYVFIGEEKNCIESFAGNDSQEGINLPHINTSENKYNVGFGFRRLSIIDLTIGGHQPFVSDCGRYMMVFNGEIYNYEEIKDELKTFGYQFRSRTDTEVVMNAYIKWKSDCVNKFNGMWSLCIYDKDEKILFASRDRFGIKPFYYINDSDRFIFASEIKQLLLDKDIKRIANLHVVKNYLLNNKKDYSEETFYSGIKQLEPGHNLIIKNGKLTIEQYWKISVNQSYNYEINHKDIFTKFLELFESSVKLRYKADVPVSVALSGGLDSSSTAVILNKLGKKRINTFTMIFDGEEFDEREYAKVVNDRIESKSFMFKPKINSLLDDMDEFLFHMEEPIRGLQTYSQWTMMRHVRENGITVLNEGQGADEILGGYEWYFKSYFQDLFRLQNLPKFIIELITYSNKYQKNGLIILLQILKRKIVDLLKTPKQIDISGDDSMTNLGKDLDYGIRFLIRELLNYGDKTSMRFSVENRVPFLDYRLVEFLAGLPLNLKINEGESKYILRRALEEYLPIEITNRFSKLGFATPQELWQKNELKEEMQNVLINNKYDPIKSILDKDIDAKYNLYLNNKFADYTYIWKFYNILKWSDILDVEISR